MFGGEVIGKPAPSRKERVKERSMNKKEERLTPVAGETALSLARGAAVMTWESRREEWKGFVLPGIMIVGGDTRRSWGSQAP